MAIDITWLRETFPAVSHLTPIGSGGQKEVFSGTTKDEGEVVLKIFYPTADTDRAEREVAAARLLRSRYVPEIFDLGVAASPLGEVIWLREEYVRAPSLRHRLQSGPLSDEEVLRLAKQQFEVLLIAEEKRLVHRDVKPENILLDHSGSSWLLDFGIARHLDMESLTLTAAHWGVGTPGYAAPEQFRNIKQDIDGRSDLFSLGVTLYECCEGENPFVQGARDVLEVIHRVESCPLPPIARHIGQDGGLRDLILAMTRTRRDHRPMTVRDASEWLMELAGTA